MDTELEKQSLEWADSIIAQFKVGQNPATPLQGDALELYRELDAWGFFKLAAFDSEITRLLLAMRKYKAVKWLKDHPPKPKLTKWEMVAGRSKRRR